MLCSCTVDGDTGDTSNVVGKESNHPDAHETFVQVERLQKPLCGQSRPHFFRGVATVSCAGMHCNDHVLVTCLSSLRLSFVWVSSACSLQHTT